MNRHKLFMLSSDMNFRTRLSKLFAVTSSFEIVFSGSDYSMLVRLLSLPEFKSENFNGSIIVILDTDGLSIQELLRYSQEILEITPKAEVFVFSSRLLINDFQTLNQIISLGKVSFHQKTENTEEVIRNLFKDLIKTDNIQPAAGKVFSFLSTAGGSGKTSLASNTALLLSKKAPHRTAILDFDPFYGGVAMALGVSVPFDRNFIYAASTFEMHLEVDSSTFLNLFVEMGGLKILPASKSIEHLKPSHIKMGESILRSCRTHFDYTVVDTGNYLEDELLTSAVTASEKAVIVMTPRFSSIANTKKLLGILRDFNFSNERLLFVLSRMLKDDEETRKTIEKIYSGVTILPLAEEIPVIPHALDSGKPVVDFHSSTQFAKTCAKIAKFLIGDTGVSSGMDDSSEPDRQQKSPWQKLAAFWKK